MDALTTESLDLFTLQRTDDGKMVHTIFATEVRFRLLDDAHDRILAKTTNE